jgi:putative ABC transport system permease protein
LYEKYPPSVRGRFTLQATATSLREEVVSPVRRALLLMQAGVSLVLLIACANAANLFLARIAGRRREIAIRRALGAGRSGIVRLIVAESLIVSLVSGALGGLVALWAVDALASLVPEGFAGAEARVFEPSVLGFALAVAIATGVVFGTVPAILASRGALADAVGAGARSGTSFRRDRARRLLVVGEVALSLVLLSSAGLLSRSFLRVMSVDPGFEPEGRLAFSVSLDEAKYSADDARTFFSRLLEELARLPSVSAVGAGTSVPLGASDQILISLEGREQESWGRNLCWHSVVAGDYFRALGIPMARGRAFGDGDRADTSPVAIVNESFARKYWPNEPNGPNGEALGRRFKWGSPTSSAPYMEIVGVVRDSVQNRLSDETLPAVYMPYSQLDAGRTSQRTLTFVLGTAGNAESLAGPVRSAVRSLDSELPVFGLATLRKTIRDSESDRRVLATLVTGFAAVAVLLAVAGLLGVLGHSVTLATREIGVRMALGAPVGSVVTMVVLDGAKLSLLGVATGILASLVAAPVLSGELYQVSAHDPFVLTSVAAILIVVSALATYLPARKAAAVDPTIAIRYD